MSQAAVADGVGVSRAWVNAVEAGKPTVEFDLVLRLLEYLGLRMDLAEPQNLGGVFKGRSGRSVDLDAILDEYRDQ